MANKANIDWGKAYDEYVQEKNGVIDNENKASDNSVFADAEKPETVESAKVSFDKPKADSKKEEIQPDAVKYVAGVSHDTPYHAPSADAPSYGSTFGLEDISSVRKKDGKFEVQAPWAERKFNESTQKGMEYLGEKNEGDTMSAISSQIDLALDEAERDGRSVTEAQNLAQSAVVANSKAYLGNIAKRIADREDFREAATVLQSAQAAYKPQSAADITDEEYERMYARLTPEQKREMDEKSREVEAQLKAATDKYEEVYTRLWNEEAGKSAEELAGAIHKSMVGRYAPKGHADYFGSKVWRENTLQDLASLIGVGYDRDRLELMRESIAEYEKNLPWAERSAGGALAMLAEAPSFLVSGGVASAGTKGISMLARKIAMRNIAKSKGITLLSKAATMQKARIAAQAAERLASNPRFTHAMQMAQQGLTFGIYDESKYLMSGGEMDENGERGLSFADAARTFGRGVALGSAVGATGLGTHVLRQRIALPKTRMGQLTARLGTGAIGLAGESAVFSAPEVIEGRMNGEDVDFMDSFVNNLGLMGGMKVGHALGRHARRAALEGKYAVAKRVAEMPDASDRDKAAAVEARYALDQYKHDSDWRREYVNLEKLDGMEGGEEARRTIGLLTTLTHENMEELKSVLPENQYALMDRVRRIGNGELDPIEVISKGREAQAALKTVLASDASQMVKARVKYLIDGNINGIEIPRAVRYERTKDEMGDWKVTTYDSEGSVIDSRSFGKDEVKARRVSERLNRTIMMNDMLERRDDIARSDYMLNTMENARVFCEQNGFDLTDFWKNLTLYNKGKYSEVDANMLTAFGQFEEYNRANQHVDGLADIRRNTARKYGVSEDRVDKIVFNTLPQVRDERETAVHDYYYKQVLDESAKLRESVDPKEEALKSQIKTAQDGAEARVRAEYKDIMLEGTPYVVVGETEDGRIVTVVEGMKYVDGKLEKTGKEDTVIAIDGEGRKVSVVIKDNAGIYTNVDEEVAKARTEAEREVRLASAVDEWLKSGEKVQVGYENGFLYEVDGIDEEGRPYSYIVLKGETEPVRVTLEWKDVTDARKATEAVPENDAFSHYEGEVKPEEKKAEPRKEEKEETPAPEAETPEEEEAVTPEEAAIEKADKGVVTHEEPVVEEDAWPKRSDGEYDIDAMTPEQRAAYARRMGDVAEFREDVQSMIAQQDEAIKKARAKLDKAKNLNEKADIRREIRSLEEQRKSYEETLRMLEDKAEERIEETAVETPAEPKVEEVSAEEEKAPQSEAETPKPEAEKTDVETVAEKPEAEAKEEVKEEPKEEGFGVFYEGEKPKVGQKNLDLLDAFGKKVGLRFVFRPEMKAHTEKGDFNANASYDKGDGRTIYLNADKGIAYQLHTIVGHETVHWLRNIDAEAYDSLRDAAIKAMKKLGIYESRLEDARRYYAEADVEEELVAEFCGDVAKEKKVLSEFMAEHKDEPKFVDRVLRGILHAIDFVRNGFGINSDEDVDSVIAATSKQMANAYRKIAERGKSIEATLQTGGGCDIEKDGQKTMYVDENNDLRAYSIATFGAWTDDRGVVHQGTMKDVLALLKKAGFSEKRRDEMKARMEFWKGFVENVANMTDEEGNLRYPEFRKWCDATPKYKMVGNKFMRAFSALVKNGEYTANIELTTDCIKREAYTAIVNELVSRDIEDSLLKNLTPERIMEIQKLMKAYGMQVACPLCFVEGKRYNIVSWAKKFIDDWNGILKELGYDDGSEFGFGKGDTDLVSAEDLVDPSKVAEYVRRDNAMSIAYKKTILKLSNEYDAAFATQYEKLSAEDKALVDEYAQAISDFRDMEVKDIKDHVEGDVLNAKQKEAIEKAQNHIRKTSRDKMMEMMKEHEELRHRISYSDLLGSKGLDRIRSMSSASNAFEKLYSAIITRSGTATPKPMQGANPYSGELLELRQNQINKAGKEGGVRMFSFSDFDITKVFDIMQVFFDCEARDIKLQAYSKEVPFILMFGGKTNAKINMSMLPEVRLRGEMEKEYADLMEKIEKAPKDAKHKLEKQRKELLHQIQEFGGLIVEDGKIKGFDWSDSHSIREDFAKQIFHDDRYNANCGAIAVGVSVNHALKLAMTDFIRMCIPFHLSGMPIAAREASDVKFYRDFTKEQNTRVYIPDEVLGKARKNAEKGEDGEESEEAVIADGNYVSIHSKNKTVQEYIKKTYGSDPDFRKGEDFDFYADEDKKGWDMRAKVRQYVAACHRNNMIPRFEWGVNADAYVKFCKDNGYTPVKEIEDYMRSHETDGVFDGYYKFITDFNTYKPVFKDGKLVGEESAPHRNVKGEFSTDKDVLETLFTGEHTMMDNRERSIAVTKEKTKEVADDVERILRGVPVNDVIMERNLDVTNGFKNAQDSELYMDKVGGVKYSIAGVIGASNLHDAGHPVYMKYLDEAVRMKDNYASDWEIFEKTGWELGADGMWRAEIKDISTDNTKKLDDDTEYRLGDLVIDMGQMGKAYPELADMPVIIKEMKGKAKDLNGAFYGDRIELNKNLLTKDSDKYTLTPKAQETLVHEIQHAIQRIEGFANGGASDMYDKRHYEDVIDKTPEAFAAIVSNKNVGIEDIFNLGPKGVAKSILNNATKIDLPYSDIMESAERISNMDDGQFRKFIGYVSRLMNKADKQAYQDYLNIKGEVEARNAARRLGWHSRAMLWATEDVVRQDQTDIYEPQAVAAEDRSYSIARNDMDEAMKQSFSSAATSLNQVASAFRKINLKEGTTNLDLGGGKYDTATKYLADKGVRNYVYDPFNRDADSNRAIYEAVRRGEIDTVTCNNVLNVIDSAEARDNVILQCAKALGKDGTAYFTVYEGDGIGEGRQTKSDSWQNNRRTSTYLDEVKRRFADVTLRNKVIVAKSPIPTDDVSVWAFGNGSSEKYSIARETDDSMYNPSATKENSAVDHAPRYEGDIDVEDRMRAINGMQKSAEYKESMFAPYMQYSISKRSNEQIDKWLVKRGFEDKDRGIILDYISENFEGNKEQLAAGKWIANGTVRMGEDDYKVRQALEVAEKKKLDPMQYDSPMAIINLYPEAVKEKPIDPDTVSTLSNKQEYAEGITVYDVEESEESRQNMRRIINTHFGKDCSPWCLLQGNKDGNLTKDSEYYWNHYNKYPKKVAFQNGKLKAFFASNNKPTWWDRNDDPHDGIPVTRKVERDGIVVVGDGVLEDGIAKYYGYHRGNKENGLYEEWNEDFIKIREANLMDGLMRGRQREWYNNGQLASDVTFGEHGPIGTSLSYHFNGQLKNKIVYADDKDGLNTHEKWYENGISEERYQTKEGKKEGKYEKWHSNGVKKHEGTYKNGTSIGEHTEWNSDGNVKSKNKYSEDGTHISEERYYPSGQLRQHITYDKEGYVVINNEFFENGDVTMFSRLKRGKEIGLFELYSSPGKLSHHVFYDDEGGKDGEEIICSQWNTNERTVIHWKHGVKDGVEERFGSEGNIMGHFEYMDGKLNGVGRNWRPVPNENGEYLLKDETHYKDGKKDGLSYDWDANGNLVKVEMYKDDKRDGYSYEWDANGNLVKAEMYKDDKLVDPAPAPKYSVHRNYNWNLKSDLEKDYDKAVEKITNLENKLREAAKASHELNAKFQRRNVNIEKLKMHVENYKATVGELYKLLSDKSSSNIITSEFGRGEYQKVVREATLALNSVTDKSPEEAYRIIEPHLVAIRTVIGRAYSRRALQMVTDMLNGTMTGTDGRGVRVGMHVDEHTRELLDVVRKAISSEIADGKDVKYVLKGIDEDGLLSNFELLTSGKVKENVVDALLNEANEAVETDPKKAGEYYVLADIVGRYDKALAMNNDIIAAREALTSLAQETRNLTRERAALPAGDPRRKKLTEEVEANRDQMNALRKEIMTSTYRFNGQVARFAMGLGEFIERGVEGWKEFVGGKAAKKAEFLEGIIRNMYNPEAAVTPVRGYDANGNPTTGKGWNRSKNHGMIMFNGQFGDSFENIAQNLDRNSVPGFWDRDGVYYQMILDKDHGWMARHDFMYKTQQKFMQMLDEKCNAMFGKTFAKVGEDAQQRIAIDLGPLRSSPESKLVQTGIRPTIAQALYIRNTVRQPNGRAGYLRWGMSNEKIDEIVDFMEAEYPEYCEFADYVVREFMPEVYKVQDEVYFDKFGTHMAKTTDYFPFRRDKGKVGKLPEVGRDDSVKLPTAMTGNIIERTANSAGMDLSADMFKVLQDHVNESVKWTAYTPLIDRFNAMITSRFINNMFTAQGIDRSRVSRSFARAVSQAQDIVENLDDLSKAAVNISRNIIAGKIVFNLNAALKQLVSGTNALGYTCEYQKMLPIWAKNFFVPSVARKIAKKGLDGLTDTIAKDGFENVYDIRVFADNWRWAIENLPTMRERWQSKFGGYEDFNLKAISGSKFLNSWNDLTSTLSKYGMAPNAMIDFFTCANVGRSVYEYQVDKNRKRGMSAEDAEWDAKVKASVFVNQTQQSPLTAFLSSFQTTRNPLLRVTGAAFGAYQNTSRGYMRNNRNAMRNTLRMLNADNREMMEKNLRENYEKYTSMSEKEIDKAVRKDMLMAFFNQLNLILHNGIVSNLAWDTAGKLLSPVTAATAAMALKYLIGNDDEVEDKDALEKVLGNEEVMKEVSEIWTLPYLLKYRNPFVYNSPLGKGMSEALQAWSEEGSSRGVGSGIFENPIFSSIDDMGRVFNREVIGKTDELGEKKTSDATYDDRSIWSLGANVATEALFGLNTLQARRMIRGIEGMFKDGADIEDVMNVLSTPRGIARAISGEILPNETEDEYLKRLAYTQLVATYIKPDGTVEYPNRWMKDKQKAYEEQIDAKIYKANDIDPIEARTLSGQAKRIAAKYLIINSNDIRKGHEEEYKAMDETEKEYQRRMLEYTMQLRYADRRLENTPIVEDDEDRRKLLMGRYEVTKELKKTYDEYKAYREKKNNNK